MTRTEQQTAATDANVVQLTKRLSEIRALIDTLAAAVDNLTAQIAAGDEVDVTPPFGEAST